MTTVQQLLDRVRRDWLTQGAREARNKLAEDVSSSASTFTFVYPLGGIQDNVLISIGLEDVYVWTVTESARTAEVDRAIDGTTGSAHTTAETVRVNPRWSDAQILRAVNSELGNLFSRGLYAVDATTVDYDGATVGYGIPAAVDRVYLVQAQDYTFKEWVELDGWVFERNQNTTDFPTGSALFLRNGAVPGREVRVTYMKPFSGLEALTDDVVTVSGIPATAVDVLAMGAALELAAPRELGRNFHETQGNTRRAQEVPPGAEAGGLTPIRRQYESRLAAEKARLAAQYPVRQAR